MRRARRARRARGGRIVHAFDAGDARVCRSGTRLSLLRRCAPAAEKGTCRAAGGSKMRPLGTTAMIGDASVSEIAVAAVGLMSETPIDPILIALPCASAAVLAAGMESAA